MYTSRTPQGVRGLKWEHYDSVTRCTGRTPQGVRGLKSVLRRTGGKNGGRTPQGVRGLKSRFNGRFARAVDVAPRKGCVD